MQQKRYTVKGVKRPLHLSPEHAEALNAKVYEPPAEKNAAEAPTMPETPAAKKAATNKAAAAKNAEQDALEKAAQDAKDAEAVNANAGGDLPPGDAAGQ